MQKITLKTAIKMWGKEATNAAEAEMKQLHWRNSFRPVRYNELSDKQKETILESHIFLTKKRTGEIKGRTVAGGNKQRNYIDKEDASSPTVAPPPPNPPSPPSPPITVSDGGANLDLIVRDPGIAG